MLEPLRHTCSHVNYCKGPGFKGTRVLPRLICVCKASTSNALTLDFVQDEVNIQEEKEDT